MGRRLTWGDRLPTDLARCIATGNSGRARSCAALPPLKSKESNTYGDNVVKRIIEAGRRQPARPAATRKAVLSPVPAPETRPSVKFVQVDEGSAGQRLDNFLLRELKGVPKTHVYRVIRAGEVRVNKGRAQADTRLALGDEVRIPPVRVAAKPDDAPAAPPREFPVVFEDEHLLAIDKPAGVAVHGGSGLSFGLIEQLRRARPQARFLELVHRLDRETSGVLLVAKKRSALKALQEQFRERETGKTYLALVLGQWPARKRVIDVPLHKYLIEGGERRVKVVARDDPQGLRAITLVKPRAQGADTTLLEVTIKTGRTHQIRVHLAQAGHPIAGDDKYGDFERNRQLAKAGLKRMFLHAWRLTFAHPLTAETLTLESPLPSLLQTWSPSPCPATPAAST